MADVKISLSSNYACVQPEIANVVIIGGGVMGMSAAWNLASRGVKGIVVLEQHELGCGSSAKPMGGVRANFSDPNNIILGKRSLEKYGRFHEDFGVNIELSKVGYLFLARNEEEAANLEVATQTQNELGVNSYMVSPQQVHELNPFIDPASIVVGAYSPDDGYACPAAAVDGYRRACQSLGVTILDHTEVRDITTAGGKIEAVLTNRGVIRANQVICAAGAWSKRIGEMAGQELPVEPVRRMIGITAQRPQAHATVPFTLDLGTTFYMHNYYNALLLGISHKEEVGFNREWTYEWLNDFNDAARIVAPSLVDPHLEAGWAGFYENTPDHNAIIGASNTVEGFYYITGFSGHGFLQGPAAGELIADIVTNKESFLPHDAFTVDRFAVPNIGLTEKHII
ncbi:NAD(P)/FAD-dependent oxidoreductase [Corynebacterium striatum]|uniref:NAD(P)/FAD-dependent oxidoreductase n=1 Tax=Corynebacterium striatum TaxID=43770 RepID=UPI0027BB1222|nr:FAD-binding oxidoreductase [Corynebacterium striatum]